MSHANDERPSARPLSRRAFLRGLGMGTGAALLAACGAAPVSESPTSAPAPAEPTTSAPAAATGTRTITVMGQRNEFSEDAQKTFETANPGLTIEFLEFDQTKLFALAAAGTMPDLFRTQAPDVPQLLARNLLLDLSSRFEASTLLKLDALAPANNYYRAESPVKIGSGPIYGMVKDWSPDFTLYAYTAAFEEAGLPIPSADTQLSYAEIAELAAKLTKKEGDRTARWGFATAQDWIDRVWMNMLAEKNVSLYSADFSAMQLTANDEARAVVQYFYDLVKAGVTQTPLSPSPTWQGEDFTKGTLGLMQYGYWFSAMAESDVTKDKVVMLPAPTWAGVRRNPTITATGMVISAQSKDPDAAWSFFEWYMGGDPSTERAKSGWGVPALTSQYSLIPTETPFQKQANTVLQNELSYADTPLQFNPYLSGGAVATIWSKQLEQALRGSMSFDELLSAIERETNTAIQDGRDRIG